MVDKRVHVFVEGRVQGVFFRAETQNTANRYHVKGWVKNLYDGRVEALLREKKRMWKGLCFGVIRGRHMLQ